MDNRQEQKEVEVWIIQIPSETEPNDIRHASTEVYDNFDLYLQRSTEIREKWDIVAIGRAVVVNRIYY
jgi:hypothetical protein